MRTSYTWHIVALACIMHEGMHAQMLSARDSSGSSQSMPLYSDTGRRLTGKEVVGFEPRWDESEATKLIEMNYEARFSDDIDEDTSSGGKVISLVQIREGSAREMIEDTEEMGFPVGCAFVAVVLLVGVIMFAMGYKSSAKTEDDAFSNIQDRLEAVNPHAAPDDLRHRHMAQDLTSSYGRPEHNAFYNDPPVRNLGRLAF